MNFWSSSSRRFLWSFGAPSLRFRVFSTYVPSGDSNGLLEALMATSPRKSQTPRPAASGSTKQRKSIKSSTKRLSGGEIADDSTQGTEKRTKPRKSTSRKSIKGADSGEEITQGAAFATTYLGIWMCLLLPRSCSWTEQQKRFDICEQGQKRYCWR